SGWRLLRGGSRRPGIWTGDGGGHEVAQCAAHAYRGLDGDSVGSGRKKLMANSSMTLRQLFAGLLQLPASCDLEIRNIVSDSREAGPGALFVALPGLRQDGRQFEADALARSEERRVGKEGRRRRGG